LCKPLAIIKKILMLDIKVVLPTFEKSPLHEAYSISKVLSAKRSKKVILGKKKDKVCRFCSMNESQTSFKNLAHLIPEFMGNKTLFSNYECDNCNNYFGNLETSLSGLGGVFNSLATLKGKKGFPKFKDNSDEIEIFARSIKDIVIRFNNPEKKSRSIQRDTNNKLYHFNIQQPSYIPQNAFKSLMKIGVGMMPETEFNDYKNTMAWLLDGNSVDQTNNPLFQVYRKLGGERRFLQPWAILFKKREFNNNYLYPKHTLVIFYGILTYQIFIPTVEDKDLLFNQNEMILPISKYLVELKRNDKVNNTAHVVPINLGSNLKFRPKRIEFSSHFRTHE
ncbi:HNH endonuclease, partial [Cochleicola gelatinilyticus]